MYVRVFISLPFRTGDGGRFEGIFHSYKRQVRSTVYRTLLILVIIREIETRIRICVDYYLKTDQISLLPLSTKQRPNSQTSQTTEYVIDFRTRFGCTGNAYDEAQVV